MGGKNERCKKKLHRCCKKKCNGYEIIKSAAMFEFGASAIVQAEAELLQKLVKRGEKPTPLILVNKQIKRIICCLKELEEKIVKKIKEE